MAYERLWPKVMQVFTANGFQDGAIQVADTAGFFVTGKISVQSTTLQPRTLQIKKIVTEVAPYLIYVGPVDSNINSRTDMSAYLVADGAYVLQPEQEYGFIKPEYIWNAVYERDPVKALRVEAVDDQGNAWSEDNPVPVHFSATFPNIVEITDGDGDILEVNPDGSINVNVNTGPTVATENVSKFTAASSVGSGIPTTIGTYTVPILKTAVLERIDLSGSNVAMYSIMINSVIQAKRRTYYGGSFNENVIFISPTSKGYPLVAGDVVTIIVLHDRPFVGDFESRIQLSLLG